jgi:hypothetical protein
MTGVPSGPGAECELPVDQLWRLRSATVMVGPTDKSAAR